LDQKFFENLKSRARAKFDQSCVGNHILSIWDSIATLFDMWKSINQDEVLDAWDLKTY
jgi:hypothetical protein